VKAWISFEEQDELGTPPPMRRTATPPSRPRQACHDAGGGRVVIPGWRWFVAGPIVLLSNVNVHLNKGAHVYFSHNPADYAAMAISIAASTAS
jgi:hypothetical protein